MLGKLSNKDLKRETFCNIMQFLIASVKKDKQMEALVEKLCNRFTGVTDVKQWEYIAYCLSQLAFTEKGIKKLIESFKSYEHVLSKDSVMEHFRIILNKGKKFAKPEVKSNMEEFEDKLNKFHMEKKDQEVTSRNAQLHQKKLGSKKAAAGFRNAAGDGGESDITEDDETDDEIADSHTEERTRSADIGPNPGLVKSGENSGVSSGVTESDPGDHEVQSPMTKNLRSRLILNT